MYLKQIYFSLGGGVRKTIPQGSSFTYHIGSTLNICNPITITNSAGLSEEFQVSMENSALAGANATESVQRTWYITETTPGGNTANITLEWDQVQEGSSFNRTNCSILKTNGTTIDYTGYTPQSGAATNVNGTIWSKTLIGITEFSPWGITSQTSLPIDLLKFEANTTDKKTAKLIWEITANSTPQAFDILKSENGKDFKSIGYIKAHRDLNYEFLDEKLNNSINYYQLKLIDNEGFIKMSKVISVKNKDDYKTSFELIPNIVTEKTHLIFAGAKPEHACINILNTNGQLIKKVDLKINEMDSYQLDCSGLNPGLYFVQVFTEGGTSESVRLMKQ